MRVLIWILFFLGILALLIGTILAFTANTFILAPQGYWRGAMAFFMLSLTLHFLTGGCCHQHKEEEKK
ncbi:MAG: hypothetical protein WHV67_08660 [Thermoanaerobaculia bacterium]